MTLSLARRAMLERRIEAMSPLLYEHLATRIVAIIEEEIEREVVAERNAAAAIAVDFGEHLRADTGAMTNPEERAAAYLIIDIVGGIATKIKNRGNTK